MNEITKIIASAPVERKFIELGDGAVLMVPAGMEDSAVAGLLAKFLGECE